MVVKSSVRLIVLLAVAAIAVVISCACASEAACSGKCATFDPGTGGRESTAPETSEYFCVYGKPEEASCRSCSGESFPGCLEGVICKHACSAATDCPSPRTGKSTPICSETDDGGECALPCNERASCPDGMGCSGARCFFMYEDTKVCKGGR